MDAGPEIIRFNAQQENARDYMLEHLVISGNEFDYRRAIKAQWNSEIGSTGTNQRIPVSEI
jgi:hypothetical protein